jgi:transcriptional accessory protein Tex/SPT6
LPERHADIAELEVRKRAIPISFDEHGKYMEELKAKIEAGFNSKPNGQIQ